MRKFQRSVVLGAGGAISRMLVPELVRRGEEVIAVSRSGRPMEGATGATADLTDYEALSKLVPENSAVYLLAGLPYDVRIWRETWPLIMDNTLRVCREKHSLLLFFDNVYMYGRVEGKMTEETPHRPASKKGEIRARIADRLVEEYSSGRVQALIARSADFYGPGAEKTGIPNLLIAQRLLEGKSAQWLVSADRPHSLTYTGDCGKALALLASRQDAHNQVWHLPTARPPISMRRLAELAAEAAGVKPTISVLSRTVLRLGGLFDRTILELGEMLYQNEMEYWFDSTKFENRFSFTPTSYEQGIVDTVAYHRGLKT